MATSDRPMINVYEPDENGVEQLVYRPMNDAELAQWQLDQATAAAYVPPPPRDDLIAAAAAAAVAAVIPYLAPAASADQANAAQQAAHDAARAKLDPSTP